MATTQENTALIDHHLSMVGKLIVNAANCDLLMYNAFRIISGCEGGIANAIYFSSESFNAKKSFIIRILKVNDDPIEREILERIISATKTANNQRNELSHSLLQVTGEENKLRGLNARRQGQLGTPMTGPFLDGLLKLSCQAHIAALVAYQELCLKRGIPPSINHE
ncbi:MAG: hypothetical protein DID92_2727743680 [Candidatus Nitrotoga sp. SPKER]|nr:MAG: hypothetical protein DID92_2727743680 [Candidatus Nitrotoga sp. SPKER]